MDINQSGSEPFPVPPAPPGATAPMFPLRDVFLFPGQILPLHIFEPRYRQMIEDSLDGTGRLVLATQLEPEEPDRPPAVLPVAGYGEIARYEQLEDGRFVVLLFGMARVHIEEIDSDRLYRVVRCQPFAEEPTSDTESLTLHQQLAAAIHTRTGVSQETTDSAGIPQLVDVLAQCLDMPTQLMAAIYTETRLTQRAREVLAAHERYPQRKSAGE